MLKVPLVETTYAADADAADAVTSCTVAAYFAA
jgi:hypothetical protein